MEKESKYQKDEFLLRIANHLMIKTSFLDNLGLYHGKMGVVLFFAHYSRYTGESLYERFAGDLLDELYEQINTGIPVNFESGLCGICWGIEYLLQNGFMKGDPNDILGDIDNIIMERDIRRIQDESVQTGLMGISYYIRARLISPVRKKENIPFDDVYLAEWQTKTEGLEFPTNKEILRSICGELPKEQNIIDWKVGLAGGCAGYGLNEILL